MVKTHHDTICVKLNDFQSRTLSNQVFGKFQEEKLPRNAHGTSHQGVIQVIERCSVLTVQHGSVCCIENQLQSICSGFIACLFSGNSFFQCVLKHLRRRHITAAITHKGHQVRIVACHVFVANCACFSGFLHIGRNCAVNTTISDSAGANTYHNFQLATEQFIIGYAVIFHAVKEVKHLLRDILP